MNRLTSILAVLSTAALLAFMGPARATQVDTNSTTTATQYAPQLVGEVLIGKTGGTDTVWVAKDNTTNGWVSFTLILPSSFGAQTLTAGSLSVQTNATVSGAATLGSVVASGLVTHVAAAQSGITNAQILTLSARMTTLTATTASTNVLAAPVNAGDMVTIINAGTNPIVFAASGNLSTTNAVTLNNRRSTQTLWAQTATNWVPLGAVWSN